MPESNWRPSLYEGDALPTELIQQAIFNTRIITKVLRGCNLALSDEFTNFNKQIFDFFFAYLSIFFNEGDKTANIQCS